MPMNVEIINKNFTVGIHGFSGTVVNNDYAGTAFKLMDRMWRIVKAKGLKNKGINIWVYEANGKIFAGVELENPVDRDTELEYKVVSLSKYAYYKHIGPYQLIKQVGQSMSAELKTQGFEISFPYLEIYGHWTNDEAKLETELLMSIV